MIVEQHVLAIAVGVQPNVQQLDSLGALICEHHMPRIEVCGIVQPGLELHCMQHGLQGKYLDAAQSPISPAE